MAMIFKNREDGGLKLAAKLLKSKKLTRVKKADIIVLGLPRGGVVTAAVVAKELGAKLSVIVSKKIGYPANPEYAIGAIAEGGDPLWGAVAEGYHFHEHLKEDLAEHALKDVQKQIELFRGGKGMPVLKGKVVVLVDDGIATGMTMRAAIEAVEKKSPRKIIVATPVMPPEAAKDMKKLVDEVVAVSKPEDFSTVAMYYVDFLQKTDEEVMQVLGYRF